MNAELEALVQALNALMESRGGEEAERLKAVFEARIEEALAKRPGLSRRSLLAAVDLQYHRWLKAERKPPSLPSKA